MGHIRSLLETLDVLVEADAPSPGPFEHGVDDGYAFGIQTKLGEKPDPREGATYAAGFKIGLEMGEAVHDVVHETEESDAHRAALEVLKHYYNDIVKSKVGRRLGLDSGDVAGTLAANDIHRRLESFAQAIEQNKVRPHEIARYLKKAAKFTAGHLADKRRPGSSVEPLPEPRAVGNIQDMPGTRHPKGHHRTRSPYGKDTHFAAPLGQIEPGVPISSGTTAFDIPEMDKPVIRDRVEKLIKSAGGQAHKFSPKAKPEELLRRVFLKRMNPRDALRDMGIKGEKSPRDSREYKDYQALEMWASRTIANFVKAARDDKTLKSFVHNPGQFEKGRADAADAAAAASAARRKSEGRVTLRANLTESVEERQNILEWVAWLQAAA